MGSLDALKVPYIGCKMTLSERVLQADIPLKQYLQKRAPFCSIRTNRKHIVELIVIKR
jgi:hypothetical protein